MKKRLATFAGGCFWCMEGAFRTLDGVIDVVSGYTGGEMTKPTYGEVSSGTTGHYEAVQVSYDPAKTTYEQLLDLYWQSIDPTDAEGQFADRGSQYMTAIFYHNAEQKKAAEKSKRDLERSGKFKEPIATRIIKFGKFYKAEEYHQNYAKKNPVQYKLYEIGSGRKSRLNKLWG